MSKLKLDERMENAVNAFFDPVSDKSELAVAFSGDTVLATPEMESPAEKADRWSRVARDILLFGPGSFLLYYSTLATMFFYPEFGVSLPGLFLLASGAFLCYAGAGKITNTRNLVVPASIVALALIVAIAASLLPSDMRSDIFFWYSIIVFPFALIAAKLLQTWLKVKH